MQTLKDMSNNILIVLIQCQTRLVSVFLNFVPLVFLWLNIFLFSFFNFKNMDTDSDDLVDDNDLFSTSDDSLLHTSSSSSSLAVISDPTSEFLSSVLSSSSSSFSDPSLTSCSSSSDSTSLFPFWVPSPLQRFHSIDLFDNEMHSYAEKMGFTVAHSTHNFTSDAAEKLFSNNSLKIVQRGSYYCNYKRNSVKNDPSRKTDCSFRVGFTFDNKDRGYFIKDQQFSLDHCHPLEDRSVTVDGLVSVNLEKQLSNHEMNELFHLARFSLPVSKVREIMMGKFPKRQFTSPLLFRILNKGKVFHFGADPDAMNEFFKFGAEIGKAGGLFDWTMDSSGHLASVFIQSASSKEYSGLYSDLTLVDGAHGTNLYGLTLVPFTNVDCLGHSIINGIYIANSECGELIEKGLISFGLAVPGATLLTDGGSAFPEVAKKLMMNHILCVHHFRTDLFSSSGGLGLLADAYKAEVNRAIFQDFASNIDFETYLSELHEKYDHVNGPQKFIQSLEKHKNKVCQFFTGIFGFF
jgi:hypothetical protein